MTQPVFVMFLNKTSTAGQADALNVFVKRLEDHIELLNRKCALQRHELWDYKKKQMNYCVSLTQKNRKLREERLSVGKKCLQDVVEVKHGAEINSFLQNTAKIRTESFISKKTSGFVWWKFKIPSFAGIKYYTR